MEVDTSWSWPVRPKSFRASWTGLVAFYLNVKTNIAASELRRDIQEGITQCNPLNIRRNAFLCSIKATVLILSRPGRSQGLLYKHLNHLLINSFIDWLTHPLVPTALQRRHPQKVRDRSSS